MTVDKVEDAGEDLAVFGIAAAYPAEPFAIEQTAVGEGATRFPRQQPVSDGHFSRQCNDGEAVGHTSGLGVVFDKASAYPGKVFQQSGAILCRFTKRPSRYSGISRSVPR